MFDLHNLLNKFVNWVNSIGESKVIQHQNNHEVISAIKVKKPKPVEVIQDSSIVSGITTETKITTSKSAASNRYGLASTASWVSSEAYSTEIPDDLVDLLGSGSNVVPVDINEMYNDPYRVGLTIQHRQPPPPPPYSHSLMGKPGTPGVSGTQPKKSKKKAK